MVKTGLGQDSHRFVGTGVEKPLRLAGVTILGAPGLDGNSDADVVLHAVTNAISGVTGVNILGAVSDEMCLVKGVTDSRAYLERALAEMGSFMLTHISVSIEALRPKLSPHIVSMRRSLAQICALSETSVAITATTGEGLTAFGRGEGVQAFAVVTAVHERLVSAMAGKVD